MNMTRQAEKKQSADKLWQSSESKISNTPGCPINEVKRQQWEFSHCMRGWRVKGLTVCPCWMQSLWANPLHCEASKTSLWDTWDTCSICKWWWWWNSLASYNNDPVKWKTLFARFRNTLSTCPVNSANAVLSDLANWCSAILIEWWAP